MKRTLLAALLVGVFLLSLCPAPAGAAEFSIGWDTNNGNTTTVGATGVTATAEYWLSSDGEGANPPAVEADTMISVYVKFTGTIPSSGLYGYWVESTSASFSSFPVLLDFADVADGDEPELITFPMPAANVSDLTLKASGDMQPLDFTGTDTEGLIYYPELKVAGESTNVSPSAETPSWEIDGTWKSYGFVNQKVPVTVRLDGSALYSARYTVALTSSALTAAGGALPPTQTLDIVAGRTYSSGYDDMVFEFVMPNAPVTDLSVTFTPISLPTVNFTAATVDGARNGSDVATATSSKLTLTFSGEVPGLVLSNIQAFNNTVDTRVITLSNLSAPVTANGSTTYTLDIGGSFADKDELAIAIVGLAGVTITTPYIEDIILNKVLGAYTNTAPDPANDNGLTATVTFNAPSANEGDPITATVTTSGSVISDSSFISINLTSVAAGLDGPPQTAHVNGNAPRSITKTFTYLMPDEDVEDLQLTLSYRNTYNLSTPTPVTNVNGLSAAVTFAAPSYGNAGDNQLNDNVAQGDPVTATVTVTGQAQAAGTMTIGLTSTEDVTLTAPVTLTLPVTATQSVNNTFAYTFTMPAKAVDDLILSLDFTASVAALTVTPSGTIDFGTATQGTPVPAAQTVTLENTGGAPLTSLIATIKNSLLNGTTAGTYFAFYPSSTQGTSYVGLMPDDVRTLSVIPMANLTPGTYTATIEVTASGYSVLGTVDLTFAVTAPGTPALSASPTSITFAPLMVGYAVPPESKSVALTNTGGVDLTNLTATIKGDKFDGTPGSDGDYFRIFPVATLPPSLQVGETAPFGVSPKDSTFLTQPGIYTATVEITADELIAAGKPPLVVNLTFEVKAPAPSIASSPDAITFTPAKVGYTPAPVSVTLTNDGDVTLTNVAAAIVGASFAITPAFTPVPSLVQGATATFTVAPESGLPAGTHEAVVRVTADNLDDPYDIPLTFVVQPLSADASIQGITVMGIAATATTATDYAVAIPYSTWHGPYADVSEIQSGNVVVAPTNSFARASTAAQVTDGSDGKWKTTVTAEDGTTKEYTVTITFADPSSDATLSALTVLGASASLDHTAYTAAVNVPYAAWSAAGKTTVADLVAGNIAPTKNHLGAAITSTTASDLEGGIWEILVTAEDGSTKTYTLTVAFAARPTGPSYDHDWSQDLPAVAPPPPSVPDGYTPGGSTAPGTPSTPTVDNPFSFRVLARTLNVRSGPGTSYAKVGTLTSNSVVSIVGYSADGLWAQTGTGSWVSLAYVAQVNAIATPGTHTVSVTSGSLNVRSGPGTSSAKIGSLSNATPVAVLSIANGWAQIQYAGGIGYVSALYLQ